MATVTTACNQFQAHTWKKDLCVNCMKPRGHHQVEQAPVPAKRPTKPPRTGRPGEPIMVSPNLNKRADHQTTQEGTDTSPKISEKPPSPAKPAKPRPSVAAKPSRLRKEPPPIPSPKKDSGGEAIIKTTPPASTEKDEEILTNSAKVKETSSNGNGINSIPPSDQQFIASDDLAKKRNNINCEEVNGQPESRMEDNGMTSNRRSNSNGTKQTRRPVAPPPQVPDPGKMAPNDLNQNGTGQNALDGSSSNAELLQTSETAYNILPPSREVSPAPQAPPSEGHYYHKYDVTGKHKAGNATMDSRMQKQAIIQRYKATVQSEPCDDLTSEQIAMPYTVVDVSKNPPSDDKPPRIPHTPAPEREISDTSTISSKTSSLSRVSMGSGCSSVSDSGCHSERGSPSPAAVRRLSKNSESSSSGLHSTSPSPALKGREGSASPSRGLIEGSPLPNRAAHSQQHTKSIATIQSRPIVSHTYELIENDPHKDYTPLYKDQDCSETADDDFGFVQVMRGSPARVSCGKSAAFEAKMAALSGLQLAGSNSTSSTIYGTNPAKMNSTKYPEDETPARVEQSDIDITPTASPLHHPVPSGKEKVEVPSDVPTEKNKKGGKSFFRRLFKFGSKDGSKDGQGNHSKSVDSTESSPRKVPESPPVAPEILADSPLNSPLNRGSLQRGSQRDMMSDIKTTMARRKASIPEAEIARDTALKLYESRSDNSPERRMSLSSQSSTERGEIPNRRLGKDTRGAGEYGMKAGRSPKLGSSYRALPPDLKAEIIQRSVSQGSPKPVLRADILRRSMSEQAGPPDRQQKPFAEGKAIRSSQRPRKPTASPPALPPPATPPPAVPAAKQYSKSVSEAETTSSHIAPESPVAHRLSRSSRHFDESEVQRPLKHEMLRVETAPDVLGTVVVDQVKPDVTLVHGQCQISPGNSMTRSQAESGCPEATPVLPPREGCLSRMVELKIDTAGGDITMAHQVEQQRSPREVSFNNQTIHHQGNRSPQPSKRSSLAGPTSPHPSLAGPVSPHPGLAGPVSPHPSLVGPISQNPSLAGPISPHPKEKTVQQGSHNRSRLGSENADVAPVSPNVLPPNLPSGPISPTPAPKSPLSSDVTADASTESIHSLTREDGHRSSERHGRQACRSLSDANMKSVAASKSGRRMMGAPPPPPSPDAMSPTHSEGSGGTSLPSSPTRNIEISSPIAMVTLPRPHKETNKDRNSGFEPSSQCRRNKDSVVKHSRNKTVSEGIKFDVTWDMTSHDTAENRTSKFLNRALPPPPAGEPPKSKSRESSVGKDEGENFYEMVNSDRIVDRGAYEDIDGEEMYSDLSEMAARVKRLSQELAKMGGSMGVGASMPTSPAPEPPMSPPGLGMPALGLPHSLSDDYLEPISQGEMEAGAGLKYHTMDRKPSDKERHRTRPLVKDDWRPAPVPRIPEKVPETVRTSISEQYDMLYSNTEELMADQEKMPKFSLPEAMAQISRQNIQTLQQAENKILRRYVTSDVVMQDDMRWSDFAIADSAPSFIQGLVGFYRARTARIQPFDCFVVVSAKPIPPELNTCQHPHLLHPCYTFTDRISAELYPDPPHGTDPSTYQFYGMVQTSIAVVQYKTIQTLNSYLDRLVKIHDYRMESYDKEACYLLAQILSGVLSSRDKGCPISRLQTQDVLIVSTGDHMERYAVINPIASMLPAEKDPSALCTDIVWLIFYVLNLDKPSDLKDCFVQIPARTHYSKNLQRVVRIICRGNFDSLISAWNVLQFVLWGPSEESLKSLSLADERQQAFNMWVDVERGRAVNEIALQGEMAGLTQAAMLRFLYSASGNSLVETAKLVFT